MENINLEKLGLLKSESQIYLALLKLGQSSAGKIAKETKLNRNSVYKGIENLILKGLISYTIKANQKEFTATNPKEIEKIISEKQKELQEIKKNLPKLQNLIKENQNKIEPKIYEGIKGAKAIWDRLLEESKKETEWLILGAPKSADILAGYFKEFNKKRANKNVKLKIIYNQNAKELIKERKEQKLVQIKVLPKEYITPSSIEIINENVLIVIYEPQIIILHLKNKEVSNSFKSYFNLLWKISKTF